MKYREYFITTTYAKMSEENSKKLWKDYGPEEKADYLKQNSSDCTFVVNSDSENQTKFPSHKWILSQVSPVFDAMFNGDFKESGLSEIPLPEEEPESFRIFLHLINTGEERIKEETSVDAILRLYKVSQKYMISLLMEVCLEKFKSICQYTNDTARLFDGDLLRIFEFAHLNENEALMERTKYVVRARVCRRKQQLTRCNVYSWDSRVFYQLLIALKSFEVIVFDMIEKYARINELTLTNSEETLKKWLECVNFEKMTPYEFMNGPGNSDLLEMSSKYSYLKTIFKLRMSKCRCPNHYFKEL